MIDPISLTVGLVGAGGTWVAAFAWAKGEGMSDKKAAEHANRVTGQTISVVGGFVGMVDGVDTAIHHDSNNSTNS